MASAEIAAAARERVRTVQGYAKNAGALSPGVLLAVGLERPSLAKTLNRRGAIRVEVGPGREAAKGQVFEARSDGQVLCTSKTPFLTAARRLIADGYDPRSTLELVRAGGNGFDRDAGDGRGARGAGDRPRGPFLRPAHGTTREG